MAAGAVKPAGTGGIFTFLKYGVVLPVHGYGLFVQVFVLDIVLSIPFLFLKHLAAVLIANPDAASMASVAAYIVLSAATATAIRVAAASAAVASYSGGEGTPHASFLRRVRRALPRGAAAVIVGWVLRQACVAAAAVAALLPLHLALSDVSISPWTFVLGATIAILALALRLYLAAVCAVAVVASAAEPGQRRGGFGAVARAWRLVRARRSRTVVYVAVTWVLWVARLAVVWLMMPQAAGMLGHVVEVFSVAAATGLYFDCRKGEEEQDKAGHVD